MATKQKPIHAAYERCEPMRRALNDMGARCIEVTEDKAGILWERWILANGTSAVLFSTPHWWDVFLPADDSNRTETTISAVKRAGEPKDPS